MKRMIQNPNQPEPRRPWQDATDGDGKVHRVLVMMPCHLPRFWRCLDEQGRELIFNDLKLKPAKL